MFSETETVNRVTGLSVSRLKICVEQGWVIATTSTDGWVFDDMDIARLHLICTLQDDMEIDEDLLPTMLSLLDQVYGLRQKLRQVTRAIAAQPTKTRKEILAYLQD